MQILKTLSDLSLVPLSQVKFSKEKRNHLSSWVLVTDWTPGLLGFDFIKDFAVFALG
jgi:hypothetical protein